MNPAVTVAMATQGVLAWSDALAYIGAQVLGAFAGVGMADVMFSEPFFRWSGHARSGLLQVMSEFVATFGLLAIVWGCRRRHSAAPFAVAAYIAAAYWCTPSTSFANPAVTLARAATDTFTGIRPVDVPGFLAGQALGAAAATILFRWLTPGISSEIAWSDVDGSSDLRVSA